MGVKNRIEELFRALDMKPDGVIKRGMVSRLFKTCLKYLDIVALQGTAIQVIDDNISPELSQKLAEIDQNRTSTHNSLIAQISAINRLCVN